ncbi:hypothetical protein HHL22_05700 [Hymenobacter sp. RP-2-7]|uniref:Uncharacterized protein n=1 Tax=Hymenobacter polaris TaxID=2682546 RepID=A0A7Y0FLP7_9BACT|nr:hypothetical protein [Hymenobacter polaris]NML64695.1 hypothetical protein [Hymenobacter polaris]
MLTLEKLTAAAQELPAEFSLGQLVDKLLVQDKSQQQLVPPEFTAGTATQAQRDPEATRYTSPEAAALYAKFPVPPSLHALRGIAAGLSLADRQKSAQEWEAERIQEKYGL